ncbi:hypothetical protein [Paenibacillus elgii]|uniref:hypothetical protein n=1 Tax=Paenibacillus elgii TaxID=189691 RepID=UPI002041F746|nr:hypothetical protein [Paenibacillus elgii]MCM3269472.1 hypothetical protein [Paenibacillus elgii]
MDLKEDYVRKAQAGDSEAFIDLMKELELPLYRMAGDRQAGGRLCRCRTRGDTESL